VEYQQIEVAKVEVHPYRSIGIQLDGVQPNVCLIEIRCVYVAASPPGRRKPQGITNVLRQGVEYVVEHRERAVDI